jgi:hypothetical protein
MKVGVEGKVLRDDRDEPCHYSVKENFLVPCHGVFIAFFSFWKYFFKKFSEK